MAKRINRTVPGATPVGLACKTVSVVVAMALAMLVSLAVEGSGTAAGAAPTNPVVEENNKTGTTTWQLRKPSTDLGKQIKGYADATSVNVGGSIDLHVSVDTPQTFTIDIYRLGYYQGKRGRLVTSVGPLDGSPQEYPPLDPETGFVEYDWPVAHRLTIPNDWVSGIYLAKLTNEQGYDNYIGFVVRNDNQQADLLFQRPILTDHAYNDFPNVDPSTPGYDAANPAHVGKSLYGGGGGNTVAGARRAVRISMNRPMSGNGVGLLFTWELDLVAWLEGEGYDVSYSTNVDTHTNPARLRDFEAFISPSHDEYWTGDMFTAAETARDRGVDLAFMGANSVYYQVDLETSADGDPNRTIFTYKDASLDPNPDRRAQTGRFRDIGRAEQALIGIQYIDFGAVQRSDLVVTNTDHWIYDGTGLEDGDRLPALVGSEIDILDPAYPTPENMNQTVLAESPYEGTLRGNHVQNTSIYQAPSGAWVFASGTLSWHWGLGRPGHVSPEIKQITRNLFDRFIDGESDGGSGSEMEGSTHDQTEVEVRVRGRRGGEIVELRDENNKSIHRRSVGTAWETLTATFPHGTRTLYVAFVNDGIDESGADRDLLVDYVTWTATGDTVQSETVESMGVWNGANCDVGFRNSEYLACNGWFKFAVPNSGDGGEGKPSSEDETSSGGAGIETISFVARGTTGTELVNLEIDGNVVRQWTVAAESATYGFEHGGGPAAFVRINFVNDGSVDSRDRNVIVESVDIDGRRFDPTTVRSRGVWNGADCTIGFRRSTFLACNGWFEFVLEADWGPKADGPQLDDPDLDEPQPDDPQLDDRKLKVRLRGTTGAELVTVTVNDSEQGRFTASSTWEVFDVPIAFREGDTVRLNYINDGFTDGRDRNLIVDWIELDRARVTASNLTSKGVWDGSRCDVERAHGSGFLACNGWIEFDLDLG